MGLMKTEKKARAGEVTQKIVLPKTMTPTWAVGGKGKGM